MIKLIFVIFEHTEELALVIDFKNSTWENNFKNLINLIFDEEIYKNKTKPKLWDEILNVNIINNNYIPYVNNKSNYYDIDLENYLQWLIQLMLTRMELIIIVFMKTMNSKTRFSII